MRLTLRPATPADHPALARIYRAASLSVAADRDFLAAHPDCLDLPTDAVPACTIAEIGGGPVGFLRRGPQDDIAGLFVDPAYQGRGIGRHLLAAIPDPVRTIANPHATGFWQACGFVQTGEMQTPGGPALRMERNLSHEGAA